jgi:hypothetical protein
MAMYEGVISFPQKHYKELNRQVSATLSKHLLGSIRADNSEPFGGLLMLSCQRYVVWRLAKICMDALSQIEKADGKLATTPLLSRKDVASKAGAEFLLACKEMSTCRPKYTHDNQFFNDLISLILVPRKSTEEQW